MEAFSKLEVKTFRTSGYVIVKRRVWISIVVFRNRKMSASVMFIFCWGKEETRWIGVSNGILITSLVFFSILFPIFDVDYSWSAEFLLPKEFFYQGNQAVYDDKYCKVTTNTFCWNPM